MSNSQNPGIFGKVWVHGSNGATVGVQTDGGSMFIAGMTSVAEPPINDVWKVPGEEEKLAGWQSEDAAFFATIDATKHYHRLQIREFLQAILDGRAPLVTGEEGRKTVEIFTAIYRSQRDGRPVRFPLLPEQGARRLRRTTPGRPLKATLARARPRRYDSGRHGQDPLAPALRRRLGGGRPAARDEPGAAGPGRRAEAAGARRRDARRPGSAARAAGCRRTSTSRTRRATTPRSGPTTGRACVRRA